MIGLAYGLPKERRASRASKLEKAAVIDRVNSEETITDMAQRDAAFAKFV
jgi:hypothetical protein